MNTTLLYEFLVLSKVLNYSKAARMLYISQSVLSRHIQELEQELQAGLFVRNSHSVTLTTVGQLLAKEGQGLIDKYDSALSWARGRSLPTQGKIRVGLGLEFSYAHHIQRFLQDFIKRFPDIQVKLDVFPGSTPAEVVGQYDVFFTPCVFPNLSEGEQQILIRQHGTYAILPHGHSLMAESSVYLHRLAGQTIIVPYAGELFGPYAKNLMLVEKATRGTISCIRVENLSTALLLVSMGRGICIAPRYAATLLPPDAFTVSISDPNCRFDEYLYFKDSGDGAARLFVEEFRNAEAKAKR